MSIIEWPLRDTLHIPYSESLRLRKEEHGQQRLHPRPHAKFRPISRWESPDGTGRLGASSTRRRRIDPQGKAAGDHWVVQEKKGRKVFSRGVWAPAATIDKIRAELEAERSTEGYAKRKEADARRRDKVQAEYVEDFYGAVVAFLAFHPVHANFAGRLARAVADHATPVGSGTVARTKRIPVEQRAEAAVIAWLRHQTTGYDSMKIARIKGKRREVDECSPSDPRSCSGGIAGENRSGRNVRSRRRWRATTNPLSSLVESSMCRQESRVASLRPIEP